MNHLHTYTPCRPRRCTECLHRCSLDSDLWAIYDCLKVQTQGAIALGMEVLMSHLTAAHERSHIDTNTPFHSQPADMENRN